MKHLLLFLWLFGFAICSYSQTLYPYSKGGKWGYCDENKMIIVQPTYDYAHPFKHGLGFVKKGKLYGAVNQAGKLVVPAKYQQLRFGYNAYIIADSIKYDVLNGSLKDARLALFDSTGKRMYNARFNSLPCPNEYDDSAPEYVGSGTYWYMEKGKYGTMNEKYKIITTATKPNTVEYSQGLTFFNEGGKYGFKDTKGTIIIPAKFDEEASFNDWGNAVVSMNGKKGVIDMKGNVVIDFLYNEISTCWNSGYFTPKKDNKVGLYDKQGREIIPCSLSYPVFVFYDGLQARKPEGNKKYGYIDSTGKYIIEAQYTIANSFYNGKALVSKGDVWYYINKKNEKLSPDYDFVNTNCMNNTSYTIFRKGNAWGVADVTCQELFTLDGVERLFPFCSTFNYFQAIKDGKYGVVNLKGEWVIKPIYDEELQYENGLFLYTYSELSEVKNAYGEKTWVVAKQFYILPNGVELRD